MSGRAQRSLSVGEVSPKLHARADRELYQSALRTLRNAIVTKEGGVESRPGTTYCGTTKASAAARLLPLVLDADQPYVLEMGAGYFRFWLNGAPVTATSIAAWADATAYTAGVVKSRSAVNYVCLLAHTSNTANDAPGTGTNQATYWYALTGAVYELPTPYLAAELKTVRWADDSPGVRFFVHRLHAMRELIRVGAQQWTFVITTLSAADAVTTPTGVSITGTAGSTAADDTRYKVTAMIGLLESPVSATVQWSRYPGTTTFGNFSPITVDWDAVAGATAYRLYRSVQGAAFVLKAQLDSTVLLYLDESLTGGVGTAYTPPTTAQAFTDFTVSGSYPGTICVYQQRLVLGGQVNAPDVVYASRTGSFRNFFPRFPAEDDDALSWKQVGTRLNRVQHLTESAGRLVVWSETTEGIVTGDNDGILRPGEANPRTWSFNGAAAALVPLSVNDTSLYVQARGSLVRDLRLTPNSGEGADLTVTASHLVNGYELLAWCYQQTPHSVIWAVREDGVLLSLTYQRETGVLGWAHHDTDGLYEDLCVVPEGTEDVVYHLVQRTINSGVVRYLERTASRDAAIASLVVMDAAVTVSA